MASIKRPRPLPLHFALVLLVATHLSLSVSASAACEPCQCTYPATRQGICGRFDIPCNLDDTCIGQWSGPIESASFCQKQCELDVNCAFFSRWNDNGCRTYRSCADDAFVFNDQVTTFQKLCQCDYGQPFAGVCGARVDSLEFYPPDDGRQPGFCKEKCDTRPECRFYSEWADLGCRIFEACEAAQEASGEEVSSYEKLCGEVSSCSFEELDNGGSCGTDDASIASWQDPLDVEDFCHDRCKENSDCAFYSITPSACRLFDTCNPDALIQEPGGTSFRKDCEPVATPSPVVVVATASPTLEPTSEAPTGVTEAPSVMTSTPTETPSLSPSASPTLEPTTGTAAPVTDAPTVETDNPTSSPTNSPSVEPTGATSTPSVEPTALPSASPSLSPVNTPTTSPTVEPTGATLQPSTSPSTSPASAPTVPETEMPTTSTGAPSTTASLAPTSSPNSAPTVLPTTSPTLSPVDTTSSPTLPPVDIPTILPTAGPSTAPTTSPTASPNATPTVGSFEPTSAPTARPQSNPTTAPTVDPTTLAPTSSSFAAIVFVSKAGRDTSGCGTEQTDACFTLRTGLTQLQTRLASAAGDNLVGALMVEGGMYSDSALSLSEDIGADELHLLAIGKGSVVFDTERRSFFTIAAGKRLVADGINIRNCETAFEAIGAGSRLDISNVEIRGCTGNDGGAIRVVSGAAATITNSKLHGNEATRRGGGIYAADRASVILRASTLSSNTAGDLGGGLSAVIDSVVTLEDGCNLTSNEASNGGGLSVESDSSLSARSLVAISNRANGGDGGAIFSSNAKITISQLTADSNEATGNGGVLASLCVGVPKEVRLDDLAFSENVAGALGGGVYISGCVLRMQDGLISSCEAESGGAIALGHGSVALNRTHLIGNVATRDGGGLFLANEASEVTGEGVTLESNTASNGNGGGLRGSDESSLSLKQSVFRKNSASNGGGGGYFLREASRSVARRLESSPWQVDGVFEGNVASYGDQVALSATELCLALPASTSCSAITATTAGNVALRNALAQLPTECAQTLDVYTDSFLPNNAVLYYRDRNGNAFIINDTPVSVDTDAPGLEGASLLAIGQDVGCLENLKIRGVPGSTVNLTLTPGDEMIAPLTLRLRMGACDPREGKVLNAAARCEKCAEDEYTADGVGCVSCPSDGAVCVNGVALLERGWWGEEGTRPLRCPIKHYCTQRDVSNATSNCREGHTGDFCLSCEEGNYFAGFSSSCEQCPDTSIMAVVTVVVVLAGILVGVTLVRAALKDESTDGLVKIHGLEMSQMRCNIAVALVKVVLAHFQLVGLCLFVRVAWQAYMVQFFAFMQAVSISGLRWAQCLFAYGESGPSTFYTLSLIVAFLPLVAIALSFGGYAAKSAFRRAQGLHKGVGFGKFMLTSTLAAGLILHILVLTQGFQFFVCVNAQDLGTLVGVSQEDANDASLLLADAGVVCGSEDYAGWSLGLGLIGLIVAWGIGFILFVGVLLFRSREERDSKVGILYRSYLPEYYGWDVYVLAYHVCYAAVIVLLQLQPDVQIFAALILLALWINRHLSASPFLYQEINTLKSFSLVTLFISLSLSAFLVTEAERSSMNEAVNGLVLAFNLLFLVYSLYLAFEVSTLGSDSALARALRKCHAWKPSKNRVSENFRGIPEGQASRSNSPIERIPSVVEQNKPPQPDPEPVFERPKVLRVGDEVIICNLTKKTEYNGKCGVILNFVHETGKFEIKLDDGAMFRLKAKNLEPKNVGNRTDPLKSNPDTSSGAGAKAAKEKRLEELKQSLAQLETENAKLKREVNYLDGLNKGIIEGS